VKRRDRELRRAGVGAERLLRTLAHLTRCLVRERDRDDTRRIDAAPAKVRNLRGDDTRLAAAGAGKHEQRRAVTLHRFALRGVQGELQGEP